MASAAATGASVDSRSLRAGDLFVALRGLRADGHDFLKEAFQRGASGAVLSEDYFRDHRNLFSPGGLYRNLLPVPGPARGFADLARWYRLRYDLHTIGITGSVGKTSTKEFLSYLLRCEAPVLANEGNLNNHLGLPLTLFRLKPSHRYCVAELGANHGGEIRFLADLLRPSAAIITQVSPAHLEGFGDLEGVYHAKCELLEALPRGSKAVLPSEDRILVSRAKALGLEVITVGEAADADCRISEVEVLKSSVRFRIRGKRRFRFPGWAAFLARNAAMAVAMAESLGISLEGMPEFWGDLRLPEGRFQACELSSGVRVIYDGYNANPFSFEKALEAFHALPLAAKRILIFSDMLELGPDEGRYHEALGLKIAQFPLDYVAAYGPRSRKAIEAARSVNPRLQAEHFESPSEIVQALRPLLRAEDAILLKASRGMKIEQVLRLLEEESVLLSRAGGR